MPPVPAKHEISRTGEAKRRGHEGRVPGIRRSPSGRWRVESPSAVPGSRTRDTENPCRAPPGFRRGEALDSRQAGRRDAQRWPRSSEDDDRPTPPQGGEPERRRDQRRTRRQAGESENPVLRNALVRDRAGARGCLLPPKRSPGMQQTPGHGPDFVEALDDLFGARAVDAADSDQELQMNVDFLG